MSATKKPQLKRAEERMRRKALEACWSAEIMRGGERPFNINSLPDDQCRAAHALLYAAVAHFLAACGRRSPKTMYWLGRRWFLAPAGQGRLEVSAYAGIPGIVSMPGVLV